MNENEMNETKRGTFRDNAIASRGVKVGTFRDNAIASREERELVERCRVNWNERRAERDRARKARRAARMER